MDRSYLATPIPLYVHSQNAGIIISPSDDKDNDKIYFELFELLPRNEDVMSNKGRLHRTFPGCAVAVPRKEVQEPSFLRTITDALAQMSHQPAYGTTPMVKKAGQMHQEDRDTTHPKMVTELLAAYLRSVGETVSVSSIQKNTRQDVLWKDSRSPWHRSALWLLIRVALQLFLSRQEGEAINEKVYKNFMLFFTAYILEKACDYDIATDLLWSAKAKVTRRRLKLETHAHAGVVQFVDNALSLAEAKLEKRWSNIQGSESLGHEFSDLRTLPVADDTKMMLEGLDSYLEATTKRRHCAPPVKLHKSCSLPALTSPMNKAFDEFPSTTPTIFKLLRLESWVESDLDTWIEARIKDEQCCAELRLVIESYHQCAVKEYNNNPEAISMMILTVVRLWIALDRSAISQCPLLADYSPCFPVKVLQKLILPKKRQMERLQEVERYFEHRSTRSSFSVRHALLDYGMEDSFAVRYFNKCEEQKALYNEILRRADAARDDKRKELARMRREYHDHETRAQVLLCEDIKEFNWRTGRTRHVHSDACEKCRLEAVMNSLQIGLHEWPLPEKETQAKTVVFELRVPSHFGHWRDSTAYMLIDVLRLDYNADDSPITRFTPGDVEALRVWFRPYCDTTPRISLRSWTKPNKNTHREVKNILTSPDEEIFARNGLTFKYFDQKKTCYVGATTLTGYLTEVCTFKLSARSRSLQQFLNDSVKPDLFSNKIISSQSECPQNLSLGEYKSMATLQDGSRIRWQNLLKEMVSPSVDFKKQDTALIILQCTQQAGDPDGENTILRKTHSILDDERFATTLIKSLSDACSRVSRNWQSAPALSAFISIACRVLSLSSISSIQKSCLDVLLIARVICINWVKTLQKKAQRATDDGVRDDFTFKSAFVALICADSFNVDEPYMQQVLSIPAQADIMIQVAIVIEEARHKFATEIDSLTTVLYHRWRQLCFCSFPILAKQILTIRSPALDTAIKASWATYQPVAQWSALEEPHQHWLYGNLAQGDRENTLIVQFSILTGQLLVNGAPLNRLPQEYELHPTYQTLFGRSTVETMPSSERGMQFSAKQAFADHNLHFNLGTEQNTLAETSLIIHASKGNESFELISPCLLRGRFPTLFVDDYVHWYNITRGYVEFCPRDRGWVHSDKHWKLHRLENGAWEMRNSGKLLINRRSTTAGRFSQIFSSLEAASYVHITVDHDTSTLEIDLPRIQLGFSTGLQDASIRSHQHRGMFVHENQRVGTLIGLRSKLVLKSGKGNARDKILIPNGKIVHNKEDDHVSVTIDQSSSTKTLAYEIDRQLGRVLDNGTLTSKLFLAYLHGLTSFCLPDPLTRSTGTDAALTILKSAAVRSFPSISQENVDLLATIAELTPGREYYPENLQQMETVHWSWKLGFLAQHSEFYESVTSLFKHLRMSQLLHPEFCVKFPDLHGVNEVLLQREKIRSAVVRTSGFGAENDTQDYDGVYLPRDRSQDSSNALNALSLATMISRGEANLPIETADIGHYVWKFLHKNCKVLTAKLPSPPSSFRYDAAFLILSSESLAGDFLGHLEAFKNQSGELSKHQMMMWLATLSFAHDPDMIILQVLASFFISPTMKSFNIPSIKYFNLSRGFESWGSSKIKALFKDSVHVFIDSCDAKLERQWNEGESEYQERKARRFAEGSDRTVDRFVEGIIEQWPCEDLQVPPDVASCSWDGYINVKKAMIPLRAHFKAQHDNLRLWEYLKQIGNHVSRKSVALDTGLLAPKPATNAHRRAQSFVCNHDIVSGPAPLLVVDAKPTAPAVKMRKRGTGAASRLPDLLDRLDKLSSSSFEEEYMSGLKDSLSALNGLDHSYEIETSTEDLRELFVRYRDAWEHIVSEHYSVLEHAVASSIRQILGISSNAAGSNPLRQHFPQPSPTFFLQYLCRRNWNDLSKNWKSCIIQYGVALTELQRANRLLDTLGNDVYLIRELRNTGHENWNPDDYPESLLLEIENGILIRNVQEQIASDMRAPPSGQNAIMQLNMGEGKSSVIVPIVAVSLADTTRLVRVVVARPQSKQMHQMLVSKVGGLLNRQIYHLPFSRALKMDAEGISAVGHLLNECTQSGGILLTQPEHILSFMLMGVESCISGQPTMSGELMQRLGFLDAHSRDIVDESDENFSVKFELLYTIGTQSSIEYSPERWICVQHVLKIFKKIASEVHRQSPTAVEIYSQAHGGFPRTRILQAGAQDRITKRIAEEICEKGLKGFPIVRQKEEFRRAVLEYITETRPSPSAISMVENDDPAGFWVESHYTLLLLRGLLAGGVLNFCFGHKRWRVDYGLDANRRPTTKLALPFRAKDNPTSRSEFSHPEVVIVLTQLSYYYGGLSNEELNIAFNHLMNSDQADVEFQAWTQGVTGLSNEFKQLSGINLDDHSTCQEDIFPHFRYSQGAINYFLSNTVFPKEMKEFPHKLSASGWDIGKVKTHPTTGFSGTNDSRAVLPLEVTQLDLPQQKHTNALVLEYLLQPENSVTLMPARANQEASDADILLDMVVQMKPPVRVILDVGAQILELDNLGVAKAWLDRVKDTKETEAVVFFDLNDQLSVLDRKGQVELLQISPYADQLGRCLVFLDEAHTRGTELKLPRDYRAAVTLGANLTKDRLVQGKCHMRIFHSQYYSS